MNEAAIRNLVVLGSQTKREGQEIEATTRFGRVVPLGKARELLPYGFASRAKKGTVLVLFEGGDVRSPVLLPTSDQAGAPDLEEGDSAIWTTSGGWVVVRQSGSVELFGTSAGGVVKAKELKAQLDKTNAVVQALLTVLTGASIPEAGNGAPSSLQAALKLALTGKSVGSFDDLESKKVFHGDGQA